MKKRILLGVGILALIYLTALAIGRYDVRGTGGHFVKVDRWTGKTWECRYGECRPTVEVGE